MHSITSALAVVFLSLYLFPIYPLGVDSVAGGFDICVRYLNEGSLYTDQPYCNQGPVIYYIGWFFERLFGYGGLRTGLAYYKLFLYVLLFYLMSQMLRSLGAGDLTPYAFLFLFFIYPLSHEKPAALTSATFYALGFCLQYT